MNLLCSQRIYTGVRDYSFSVYEKTLLAVALKANKEF